MSSFVRWQNQNHAHRQNRECIAPQKTSPAKTSKPALKNPSPPPAHYEKFGYMSCPPFGEYVEDLHGYFVAKVI
ncbi:MAG: hypothetical protein COC23_03360 [Hyphomicrobiales bacterium]|nr:MAG: hypothetical protein COC23_03360 [Hyphomicrobiales bacterium]